MCVRNDRGRRSSTSSSKTESSGRRSSSRARSVQRSRSFTTHTDEERKDDHSRRRSRSASIGRRGRGRSVPKSNKKGFDTPFDKKGRCHHHPNVQLAKKKLTGWKVIVDTCPMCLEGKSVKSSNWFNRSSCSRSKSRNSRRSSRSVASDRSVSSRRSSRSCRSVSPGRKRKEKEPFDSKGYCHRHSNVRLAKKKFTGGWKLILVRCPECTAEEKDSRSVSSKSSRRSRSRSVCSRRNRSRSSRRDLRDERRRSHRNSDESISEASSHTQKVRNVKKIADIGIISYETLGNPLTSSIESSKMMVVNNDKSKHTLTEEAKPIGKNDTKQRGKRVVPEVEVHSSPVPIGAFDDSAIFETCWESERRKAVNCIKVLKYN